MYVYVVLIAVDESKDEGYGGLKAGWREGAGGRGTLMFRKRTRGTLCSSICVYNYVVYMALNETKDSGYERSKARQY